MRNTHKTSAGFSLIELLIVAAIIGVLAGIIIPTYASSIRRANEANAVAAVKTIKTAQMKYVMNHDGRYGTFRQLTKEGLLDKRFNTDSPVIKGYVFTLMLVDINSKQATTFRLNANPEISEGISATGEVFYYSEPDTGIFINRERPASSDDDIL